MPETLENQQTKVQRTRCPFYGFSGAIGMFMDQQGNQCPLKAGYSPCLFVYQDKEANWQECPLNRRNSGLLERFNDWSIFPREHEPQGVSSWKGIRFGDWADYILNGKPLPIEI